MILEPLNDHRCLAAITDQVRAKVTAPEVAEIASRFTTTQQLVRWIRTLPHRPDTGDPVDGPKVQCDVPQRLRLPTGEPNCVERSALFLLLAEHIDPSAHRRLATVDTPRGRHTFPVENGKPVRLDPQMPRNALLSALDAIDQAAGGTRALTVADVLLWCIELAAEPARDYAQGRDRLGLAQQGAIRVAAGLMPTPQEWVALAWAAAVAEREARRWWTPQHAEAIHRAVVEVERMRREAMQRDGIRLMPPDEMLRVARRVRRRAVKRYPAEARIAERVGLPLISMAVKAELASMGVPPFVVDVLEEELTGAATTKATQPALSAADTKGEREAA